MRTIPLILIDHVAVLLAHAHQLARARLTSHPSPVVRLAAGRDHVAHDLALNERQCNVLRAQRRAISPRKRPDYAPTQHVEILQIMRLRSWSIGQAAAVYPTIHYVGLTR